MKILTNKESFHFQYKKLLSSHNLEKFIPRFEEHEIDDQVFVKLTKDEILKIVEKIGPMFKIEQIVKEMASAESTGLFARPEHDSLYFVLLLVVFFVPKIFLILGILGILGSCWQYGYFDEYFAKGVKKCQEMFQVYEGKFKSLKASLHRHRSSGYLAQWLNQDLVPVFKTAYAKCTKNLRRTLTTNYRKPPPPASQTQKPGVTKLNQNQRPPPQNPKKVSTQFSQNPDGSTLYYVINYNNKVEQSKDPVKEKPKIVQKIVKSKSKGGVKKQKQEKQLVKLEPEMPPKMRTRSGMSRSIHTLNL